MRDISAERDQGSLEIKKEIPPLSAVLLHFVGNENVYNAVRFVFYLFVLPPSMRGNVSRQEVKKEICST